MALVNPVMRERAPLDVFGVVLSHVQDVESLRSCTLVCSSWRPLAWPYLFRRVVYRPAVPSRTFKHLMAFLSTLPQPGRFLRSVTVDGLTRDGERRLEMTIDEIVGQLAQLPTVTHLTLTNLRLVHPTSAVASHLGSDLPTSPRRISMKELRIQECIITRNTLSHFERVDALTLKHVFVDSPSTGQLGLVNLPPLEMQLQSVSVNGVFGNSDVLNRLFDGFSAQSRPSPLTFAIALRGLGDRAPLNAIVRPLKQHICTLSVNVLGLTCNLKWLVEGLPGNSPSLKPSDIQRERPDRLQLYQYPSLKTLVLYSTTSSLLRRESATVLYAGILANNWMLLSQAPIQTLRHVELRFQRYGAHWRDTIDELSAIDDMDPSIIRWETVDAGVLARFPYLESFTCVLCDGGFMEQWGPFKSLAPPPRSIHPQQVEFDDYVAFLKDVFPRLYAAGRLHFRMSGV